MNNILVGFYGCSRKHRINLPGVLVITNDIDNRFLCSYTCDVRELIVGKKIPGIFITDYDFYIFTPPCNYYSRGNYRREVSTIAQQTKDILPFVLDFCVASRKPFLVENVMNSTLLSNIYPQYQFCVGGHTFWSNYISLEDVKHLDFIKNQNKNFISSSKRDMNPNVHIVINEFLIKLKKDFYNKLNYQIVKNQVFIYEP